MGQLSELRQTIAAVEKLERGGNMGRRRMGGLAGIAIATAAVAGLKLAGVLALPWWLVTAPLWGTGLFIGAMLAIAAFAQK